MTRQEAIHEVHRAIEMLLVVERFMDENPIASEYTVDYDETTCDGVCLGSDCKSSAQGLALALATILRAARDKEGK